MGRGDSLGAVSSSRLLAVLASLASVGLTQSADGQRRVFRDTANLVLVDVYPHRDGRIVEGLTRDDFEVSEDSVPQAVEAVEFIRVEPNPPDVVRRDPNTQREALAAAADPYSRVFVVLLDTLHTTSPGSHVVQRPLMDVLNRLVTPDDLIGVLTQAERPTDLVLGRRLDAIEDLLKQYWARGEGHTLTDIGGSLAGIDDSDRMERALESCFGARLVKKGDALTWEPWYIDDGPARRLFSEVLIERRREDRVVSALERLVAHLGEIRNGRTVLLVVTGGWLWFPVDPPLAERLRETEAVTAPRPALFQPPGGNLATRDPHALSRSECNQELNRLASLDNPQRLRTLIDEARRRSVSIYPIDPGPEDPPPGGRTSQSLTARTGDLAEWHRRRGRERTERLREVAGGTDAFAVVSPDDLTDGLRRVAEDVSAYYLLGYYSTNTEADGRYRTIRVSVRQPGMTVRARRGYRALAAATSVTLVRERPDLRALALDEAFERLSRLRRNEPMFSYGVVASGEASVVVELAAAEALAAKAATPVTVDIVGSDGVTVGSSAGQIAPGTRGVVLRVPLGTGGGPWRANLTVGRGDTRRQDSLAIAADRSALAGPAVVFRATPSPRSPLGPVADMLFRRTERVHVEWTRLAEVDRREVRLLGRDGKPLAVAVALTERERAGRAAFAADLNLAPLTDGEYALELTVESGDRTERRIVAIRVTR